MPPCRTLETGVTLLEGVVIVMLIYGRFISPFLRVRERKCQVSGRRFLNGFYRIFGGMVSSKQFKVFIGEFSGIMPS